MRGILCWPGGKRGLTKTLLSYVPKHRTYVEPFAGGGNLFFAKQPSDLEVLADANADLINFYRQLRNARREDWENFDWRVTPANWDRAEVCKSHDFRCFYYYVAGSYGCKGEVFGSQTRSPTALAKLARPLQNSGWIASNFDAIKERLRNVKLLRQDFRKTIAQFDSPETFFYVDPPFVTPENQYYALLRGQNVSRFTEADHVDLARLLAAARGKWLLSYNDHPLIQDLYSKFDVDLVRNMFTIMAAGPAEKHVDLLIRNYPAPCSQIQPIRCNGKTARCVIQATCSK